MKKFKIEYSFNGTEEVEVEAENKEEAKTKSFGGDWSEKDTDTRCDYPIESIS